MTPLTIWPRTTTLLPTLTTLLSPPMSWYVLSPVRRIRQLASTPASTRPEMVMSPVRSGPADERGAAEGVEGSEGAGKAEPALPEGPGDDDTMLLPSADGLPEPWPQPVIRPAASNEASNPTTVR